MLGKADLCKNQTSCVTGTLFISLLQKRKENSCHTQKRVNQCSVTDTRRQMGPMYKRFQHIYTCTHRIMHRRHTICHICTTATQRQHDTEHSHTHTHTLHFHRGQKRKNGFSGRTKWTCGSLESSTSSTYTRTSPLALKVELGVRAPLWMYFSKYKILFF